MAESFVNVTEGSGKKLHTWSFTIGANTVEDEIVRLGDQYLAAYVVSQGTAVSVATANDHTLQIMAGASLNVYVRRIRIWQAALATTAAIGTIQILRLTTAGTGGGAFTFQAFDATDAAAGATAMTLPTVKGTEGARLGGFTVGYTQTVPTAGVNPLLADIDFDRLRIKPIRIPAGTSNGICIKHVTAIAAATVFVTADITEANF